jgi:hypothetical protein
MTTGHCSVWLDGCHSQPVPYFKQHWLPNRRLSTRTVRNRLWILRHVLKFQPRRAKHHIKRDYRCRSANSGRLMTHLDLSPTDFRHLFILSKHGTKANIRSTKMANNRHAYNRDVLQSYWTSDGLPLYCSQPTGEKTHTI